MKKNRWMMAAAALVVVSTVTSTWAQERNARSGKKVTTSFRLASDDAVDGFVAETMEGGQTVYVASSDAFGIGEVVDFQTARARGGDLVKIVLQPGVSEELAVASGQNGADQLAIVRGGRVVGVGGINSIGVNETILSGVSSAEVGRLARLVASREPAGEIATVVSVVPRRELASSGGTVTVDVFVSNAPNLRTYQFSLDASGGTNGSLVRTDGVVDQTRGDFVFGTDQVIQAVDKRHGRFGAVLFNGGKDVTEPGYVGSYSFEASPEAKGAFTISVNPTRISFMSDAQGEDIRFRSVPATVTVR